MTRLNPWPAAVVATAATVLVVVGCNSGTSDSAATQVSTTGQAPAAKSATKLFQNWPKPVGALVITGEQGGYLTPCGCTEGQKGGLIRRMRLVEQLRAQGWPLALIDLGSLINDPTLNGGPEQTKIRYTIALQALEMLGYDALAFSAPDLKLTVAEVLSQFANLKGKLKVVSANVTPEPAFGLEKTFLPSLRAKAGTKRLGITAVLDPATYKPITDADISVLLTTKPPEDVLPATLADLEKDTDVQVLMVQGPPEAARRLAKAHPGFDVVVATSILVDPPKDPEPLNGGRTWLVQVGKKGQNVGVIGLFDDAKQPMRYQRIELHINYDTPELVKLGEPMRKLLDEQFPSALKGANVLENFPRRKHVFGDIVSDAVFIGAETCKGCHPKSYERWERSKHAKAYRGLVHEGRNREADAECVRCHTTGFEYLGGFVTAETTSHLKGNQCENCHGPGSQHAAEPDNPQFRQAVARDVLDFEENHRCLSCHDEDNDTDFEFWRDWSFIDHTGRDSYDDPKVHVGIQPKATAAGAP